MAKKIRFPLKMNGTDVRTIEELRENFDLESVLGYFANGKLATWLKDRYYDNEAMAVESLSADDEKLHQKLCSVLKVSYTEENSIDIATVKRRNEKIAFLKQVNDGEKWISKVDAVAFNQEDLLDILDTGTEKMIYLYEGDFEIPLTVKNITYFGINNPSVLLRAYDNVNFSALNLKFVDLCFGWDVSNVSSADRMYQAETLFNLGKYDESIEILEKLAEEDNPRACLILCAIYKNIKINDEKADKFGNKVADMGDVIALVSYERKILFNVKTLERLAEKNDAIAKNSLGRCYAKGQGVEQSWEKAVEWYQKSAKQGYEIAQYNLGLCYEIGKGVKQSWEKAVEWYRKSAEQGDATAQYNLGWCYKYGKGVEQDYKKAFEWYHKSAEQGYEIAQYNLGLCYEYGIMDVKQDYEKAFKLYRKSAELGNAIAQCNLGLCYENGKGIEQSWEKAVEWYCKSAEKGNASAQYNLGECFYYGKGVKQNYEKAVEWYRKSAEQGDATAQYSLGWCYEKGQGIEQSWEKAVEWYRKSAEQGNKKAQNSLDFCCRIVEQSNKKTFGKSNKNIFGEISQLDIEAFLRQEK